MIITIKATNRHCSVLCTR